MPSKSEKGWSGVRISPFLVNSSQSSATAEAIARARSSHNCEDHSDEGELEEGEEEADEEGEVQLLLLSSALLGDDNDEEDDDDDEKEEGDEEAPDCSCRSCSCCC